MFMCVCVKGGEEFKRFLSVPTEKKNKFISISNMYWRECICLDVGQPTKHGFRRNEAKGWQTIVIPIMKYYRHENEMNLGKNKHFIIEIILSHVMHQASLLWIPDYFFPFPLQKFKAQIN